MNLLNGAFRNLDARSIIFSGGSISLIAPLIFSCSCMLIIPSLILLLSWFLISAADKMFVGYAFTIALLSFSILDARLFLSCPLQDIGCPKLTVVFPRGFAQMYVMYCCMNINGQSSA